MQLSRRVSSGSGKRRVPAPAVARTQARARAPRSHISPAGGDPGALGPPTRTNLSWHKPRFQRGLQASGSRLERSGLWFSQPRWPDARGVTGTRAVGAAAELLTHSRWEAHGPGRAASPRPRCLIQTLLGTGPALTGTIQRQSCPDLEQNAASRSR